MLTLLLLCLSITFIAIGIYRLRGPVTVWYIAYGIASMEANYLAIPCGIALAFIALAVSSFIPNDWKMFFLYAGIASLFLGAVLGRLFLKPLWLKWLEREHGEIMPILQMEIQEVGPENWNRHISTQEELASWVDEVRRKQNLMQSGA